ncbi:hypothetical protein PNQ92_06780 [Halobacterium salinarum]|uniref:hypothetical protein n=1 Tax=Halobacterium salinarum TaxID=2242 RepID=UPI0025527E5B|nr:hypothetical protein [Halobacterium salinarum]MDL0125115.1 hypothetical protein [Halobacterium salinarum]
MIAADNSNFGGESQTPYLTQGETTAIKYGTEYSAGVVMSDYTVSRKIQTEKSHILIVDPETRTPVTGTTDHIILLRDEELRDRGLQVYPSSEYSYRPWLGRVMNTKTIIIPDDEYLKVYDGPDTSGYISAS